MSHLSIRNRIKRVNSVMHLYEPEAIAHNFRNMHNIITSRTIRKGPDTFSFDDSPLNLPETFPYEDKQIPIVDFLVNDWTTGLIVIKDDAIVYENYWLGNTRDSLCISWSMGKSIVSALVGAAICQGYIPDVNVIVSDIATELKNSGYKNVTLKNVLQMSSGVHFDEDYERFFSDMNKMGRSIAFGFSMNRLAANLHAERPQGTYNHYVSMDTQVLGMVVAAATGMNLSDYLSDVIWSKIGMESDAKWLIDNHGVELSWGTINATLRDYARFGRLYLNKGNWNGQKILPEQWIMDSVTPDAPHLQPGSNNLSDYDLGYGYQWWIPAEPIGDFMALGYKGQSIYVNPEANLIVARTCANPEWTVEENSSKHIVAMCQYFAKVL